MGSGTYRELKKPFHDRVNYVVTRHDDVLRDKFEKVADADDFLDKAHDDVWVIGGAQLFASTIGRADELYITQIEQDFNCTKFFPEYKNDFTLADQSPPHEENGIKYRFEVWRRQINHAE